MPIKATVQKLLYLSNDSMNWADLSDYTLSIHTSYPANFIKTTDMVQQIQLFKLRFTFSNIYTSLFTRNVVAKQTKE